MLAPDALITLVTALAGAIARDRENDEVAMLGTVFTQLGDTLTTISAAKDIIKNKQSNNTNDTAATTDTTNSTDNTDKKEGENSD